MNALSVLSKSITSVTPRLLTPSSFICQTQHETLQNKRFLGQFRPRQPIVPPNMQYAIDYFEKSPLIYDDNIQKLMKAFHRRRRKFERLLDRGLKKKYPFIVLEGLDGCGKSAVGKRVAKIIGGVYKVSPSAAIAKIRANFEDASLKTRAAYYTLGNYIVAMEVFPYLAKKTVILDRYWHSTNAFHIAVGVQHDTFFPMPRKGDKIFRWPRDLLKPDIALFLHVDEDKRVMRHCTRGTTNTNQEQLLANDARFRNNVLTAFKRMYDPPIYQVDANPKIEDVITNVMEKIGPVLKKFENRRKKL